MNADILLVTATTTETRAVLRAFSESARPEPESLDGRVYFDLGTVNGTRLCLTQCEMGTGGLGASLQAVSKGILSITPAAVIMVGIAFGVNEQKQKIGEILISQQLRPYELQRVGTRQDGDVMIVSRGDKPHASHSLLNHFRSAEVSWEGPALSFGTVLTGEKLIDNLDFCIKLVQAEPEAVGGEMEGAGLYAACTEKKVDWILVKSICDFADGKKREEKEERQALAARNAAEFVHHTLRFVKFEWSGSRSAPKSKANRGRSVGTQTKLSENAPSLYVSAMRASDGDESDALWSALEDNCDVNAVILGRKLREVWQFDSHCSKFEFARLLQIPPKSIDKFFNGDEMLDLNRILVATRLFKLAPDYFFRATYARRFAFWREDIVKCAIFSVLTPKSATAQLSPGFFVDVFISFASKIVELHRLLFPESNSGRLAEENFCGVAIADISESFRKDLSRQYYKLLEQYSQNGQRGLTPSERILQRWFHSSGEYIARLVVEGISSITINKNPPGRKVVFRFEEDIRRGHVHFYGYDSDNLRMVRSEKSCCDK